MKAREAQSQVTLCRGAAVARAHAPMSVVCSVPRSVPRPVERQVEHRKVFPIGQDTTIPNYKLPLGSIENTGPQPQQYRTYIRTYVYVFIYPPPSVVLIPAQRYRRALWEASLDSAPTWPTEQMVGCMTGSMYGISYW